MSGDVFGNGMLLSRHIQLVAAFNHLHVFLDPDPDSGRQLRRARSGCSSCQRSSWSDYDPALHLRGRRRLLAHGQVDRALPRGRGGSRHRGRQLTPERADPGDPAGPRRPALQRRHRHLREGLDRDPRRRGRQGQRPLRVDGASCAAGWWARAATSASPSAAASSTRSRGGRTDQHRRHRQRRRRQHLRPRGQHQDPARRPGRTDGDMTVASSATSCWPR